MKRLTQLLLPSCVIALAIFLCAKSVAADKPSGLKVKATIPAHVVIRGGASFRAKLLVENPTGKAIRFSTDGCSWYENWKTDNGRINIAGWSCFWNPYQTIEIQPGGSFTDEFDVYTDPKIAPGKVAFRFGFLSIDPKEACWSNKVEILVDPNAPGPAHVFSAMEGEHTLGKGCRDVN